MGGRRLSIDLAECLLPDSAFLGTLHEVIAGGQQVTLYLPSEEVRRLFDELGLGQVLQAINDERTDPPGEPIAIRQELPAKESALRLLRAHEIRAEISEENRKRFAGVVGGLRAELSED